MSADESAPLTYKTAGVDIDAGTALVERIKGIAGKTRIPGVLAGIGGFASLFEMPLERYRQPVLVAATDGVGTKLKLAGALGRHDSIGIDLVAMCVNDIVVQGATPLFFLDYFSTGKLSVELAAQVIEGIGEGCRRAGIALVGGETAEMPGMYGSGEYDLAGFCVGLVEKGEILDGSRVCAGDRLIGVASSGPHSNGYSLIRKIMERENASLEEPVGGKTLGQLLIEPTRIYVKPLLQLFRDVEIHAMAHITGGGMSGNLPRVLPEGLSAAIDVSAWERPAIFRWLQQRGRIEEFEMLRTFNCGIGMILCVPPQDEAATLSGLAARGEKAFSIGSVVAAEGKTPIRFLTGARGTL